jgi:magnesium-transporting ATPase (P-type)
MRKKSVAFVDNNLKTELVMKEEKDQRESLEIVNETKPRKSILKKKISKFYPTVEFSKDPLHQSSKDTRHIYINNQEKNKKKYDYQDNFIKTSKYNVLNFLPKALLSQFKRYANIYFLFIGIIQCIPQISPLNPSTAIAPFFLVLMISIVREGIEDYYKHVNDAKENMEKVLVFNAKNYSVGLSKNLKVGDIVKVEEYGVIPADLLLLSTSNLNKMAYIETANLDGEKNLKPKFCIESTFRMFKEADEYVRIRGKIVCDKPNSDLNKFYGRLKLNSRTDISMSVKQLLYKGL